jgi:hypothetical protein
MLYDLKEFIGEVIVSRDIEHKGKKQTFYFAEISSEEAEDLFLGISKTDEKKNRGLRSKIIASCVRDKEGAKAFTIEEANKLPLWLVAKLQDACLEVNGLTNEQKEETKKE